MKAYLKIDTQNPGFPPEISSHLVITDYAGKLIHGLFDKSNIKNGCLEVSVLKESQGLISVVSPNEFFNHSNIVIVKRADLTYIQ